MSDVVNSEWLSNIEADSDIDQELLLHYMFKSTFGKNYLCPFSNSMKKCLDIGYSSGIWMMEMSSEFPRCEFVGVDPKPRSPDLVYPDNCLFGQEDYIKNKLTFEDHEFDVVHLRMVLFPLNTEQTTRLLDEATRVTKSGGYIEFLEPVFSSFSSCSELGPLSSKLLSILTDAPDDVPDGQLSNQIGGLLAERGFKDIETKDIAIPLGKWGSMVGEFSLAALKLFVSTSDYIKSELGIHDSESLKKFLEDIDEECEKYKPKIHIFGGFAQKS